MKATLIAHTQVDHKAIATLYGLAQDDDDYDGDTLAEFAGRACYQSWTKPNPATATNVGYLANIIDKQHFSVLEHASATFYITGVSRSLTHELVRHRHLSFSELSQRYVDVSTATMIAPPGVLPDDADTMQLLANAAMSAQHTYTTLVDRFTLQGMTRKEARQAARAVLPNMTETKIVVTGNYRAWREFIAKRATVHADLEIRALACAIASELAWLAPHSFQDLHRHQPDGRDAYWFGPFTVL